MDSLGPVEHAERPISQEQVEWQQRIRQQAATLLATHGRDGITKSFTSEGRRALCWNSAAHGQRRLLNKPRTEPASLCPACHDTGLLAYHPVEGMIRYCAACERGRQAAEEAARFYAQMQAEREAHIRQVNGRSITTFTQLHEVRLDALPTDLAEFLATWDGQRGLLLLGPWGLGKTWRLVALAQALQERAAREEWTMHLITVPELLDTLREGYDHEHRKAAEGFGAVIQQYKVVRLLVLDDWGKEKPTEWAGEQFFKIVNYRYEHRLPTFLTSNLTRAQLEQEFPAEMDRFRQVCQVIEYAGESKRKPGGR